MSPALNGNTAPQCFERSNVVENTQWNNVQFLPGTATYASMKPNLAVVQRVLHFGQTLTNHCPESSSILWYKAFVLWS